MIKINGIEIEGNCISINNGEIKISTGETIKISSFKEKEIHIHGDVKGDVDGTNINVYGKVEGDIDGTNVTVKDKCLGNIDGVNVIVRK